MAKLLSFLASLASGLISFAQAEQFPGVGIQLISENTSISAGSPFTVGLHLRHQTGYHTYWKNPGIVGLATSLKWELPKGFTASEISWPSPERSLMAGHPCHGYERDVILLVTISPPQELTETKITLKASAQWMCCAKSCHPGFNDFALTIPVADQFRLDSNNTALFKKARKELPDKNTDLRIRINSAQDSNKIILAIKAEDAKSLYFFSSDCQVSSNLNQDVQKTTDGTTILTLIRSEFSPKGKQSLPGVLQVDSCYYQLDLPYPSK